MPQSLNVSAHTTDIALYSPIILSAADWIRSVSIPPPDAALVSLE